MNSKDMIVMLGLVTFGFGAGMGLGVPLPHLTYQHTASLFVFLGALCVFDGTDILGKIYNYIMNTNKQ